MVDTKFFDLRIFTTHHAQPHSFSNITSHHITLHHITPHLDTLQYIKLTSNPHFLLLTYLTLVLLRTPACFAALFVAAESTWV